MLNEVNGQNPYEMNLNEIHNTLVQIQMASTRILMAIDILLRVDDVAEEMPDDEDEPQHIFKSANLVSATKAAQLIKNMGSKDAESDDRAQTGTVMGYTDRSIWLCPRCLTIITNLEYRHLNLNGCCEECETKLEQYEKVEWRP